MMLNRALILFLWLQSLLAIPAYSQGGAGQAGEFLRSGVGAKALGLGRAFTSISDDASAIYWNPAGLSALSKIGGTVMFMHLPLREGASINYLGGAIPLRLFFTKHQGGSSLINTLQDLKLGLGVVWHSLGEFEVYGDDAVRDEDPAQNSVAESAIYVSASYPLNMVLKRITPPGMFDWARFLKGDLDMGLTTKFVRQDVFGLSGSATTLDVGFKYAHLSGLFNAGFVLRDFNGSRFSSDSGLKGDPIPANGVLGVSFTPPFGRLHGLVLSFDYGVITPPGRDKEVMFGVQYDLSYIDAGLPVQLRFGVNSKHESFTFGIHFSPESLLDQDWVPSGDWTYAKDRGSFDAIGARYSLSVDRNPFTARYWYLNANALFQNPACHDVRALENVDRLSLYLKNAREAKNPGNRAYRYEAALRSADLSFLAELGTQQDSRRTDEVPLRKSGRKFDQIARRYQEEANRHLVMDYGKSEIDREAYFRSFLYFVQSLILSGNHELAVAVSGDGGKSWGRRIDFSSEFSGEKHQAASDYLSYLYAYALYANDNEAAAINVIRQKLSHSSVAKFLQGHMFFLEGNYNDALASLRDIDMNDSRFPEHIYVPITNDCTFGDEILFLRAASMYKLSLQRRSGEFIDEFAKIPRFFPTSDLARFLTNGNHILTDLIEYQRKEQYDSLDALVLKMIKSYIKTFSNGTLMEEFYTFNYR
ncbi:MAG: hypothetical protein ACE5IY_11165 [bacterium]